LQAVADMVNMIVRMRRWVVRKIILTIRYTDTVWRRETIVPNKRPQDISRRTVPMKLKRLFVFAFVFSVVTTAIAQDSLRLQFDVTKDGSNVAKPEVSVNAGSAGLIEIDNVGRLSFTPTVRGSGVAIAFDISSGGKQFQPRLVIRKDESGSISWTSVTGAESFKLTVSWVR